MTLKNEKKNCEELNAITIFIDHGEKNGRKFTFLSLIVVLTIVVFTSKRMLPVAHKDDLPTTQKSFVIYEYKCHCDSRYIERTSQRLQDRIKQHVQQWLRQQN